MPTFTSIALDRLLEPGATRSMTSHPKSLPRPNGDKNKLNRRNSVTAMPSIDRPVSDRKYHWPQITPALYTTPETTPLPDSPSSFPPSPYIINHKRRGPRLLKSHSVSSVPTEQPVSDQVNVNGSVMDGIEVVSGQPNDTSILSTPVISPTEELYVSSFVNGRPDAAKVSDVNNSGHENSFHNGKGGVSEVSKGMVTVEGNCFHVKHVARTEASDHLAAQNAVRKSPPRSPVGDGLEGFVDPQESLSFSSTCEVEDDICMDISMKLPTPGAEFFDAWEDLSSEGGAVLPSRDFESELREMRLSLILEVEKRKQAEDAVNNTRMAWERIREELSQVGIAIPSGLSLPMDEEYHTDHLCQQVHIARFVSESIGRGLAKADAQVELEAQLEAKNFEIARLCDRMNYYETVNREMSQRNQESIELARRQRQKKMTKRRWVWGSIAAAVTIGTVSIALAYIPASRGSESSSTNHGKQTS